MRNGDMILFMELCDYDLDHYVKQSPFNQRDVKVFLSHMGRCLPHKSPITSPFPPSVCNCFCAAAEGLRVLQERGIVHRDLKPQNILVTVDPVTEKKQVSAVAVLSTVWCSVLAVPAMLPRSVFTAENCGFWFCKALY